MSALIAVLSGTPASEAVRMFSNGVMLAIALFKATKTAKKK
jgi:hypothetical protein